MDETVRVNTHKAVGPYELMNRAELLQEQEIDTLVHFVNLVLETHIGELVRDGSVRVYDSSVFDGKKSQWDVYCERVIERFRMSGWIIDQDMDYESTHVYTFMLPGKLINPS